MGERIVMLGAGAVGGYVGGHLALHGYDVTLIEKDGAAWSAPVTDAAATRTALPPARVGGTPAAPWVALPRTGLTAG